MLNLSNPINYTKEEKVHVKYLLSLKDHDGDPLSGPKIWEVRDAKTKALKCRINSYSLQQQGCKCAYCERWIGIGNNFIEHFAPKAIYRLFTFEPLNLFVACGRCNCTTIKGERNTIKSDPCKKRYQSNKFTIVHPFLDDPSKHIVFNPDGITFDKEHCTKEGLATIDFFQWDAPDERLRRTIEKPYEMASEEIREYIRCVSTYKK